MDENLLLAVHAFLIRMLTLRLVIEIKLQRYMK